MKNLIVGRAILGGTTLMFLLTFTSNIRAQNFEPVEDEEYSRSDESVSSRLEELEKEIQAIKRNQVKRLPAVDGESAEEMGETSVLPHQGTFSDVNATDLADEKVGKKQVEVDYKPTVKIRGRIHTDLGVFDQSELNRASFGDIKNGADFRRARIGVEGNVGEFGRYRLEPDFVNGNIVLQDAWIGAAELPVLGMLQIGHFREPFSLEALTSSNQHTFIERASPNVFDPARNWGISSFNYTENEAATFGMGVFRTDSNNFGDDVGDSGEWSYTMRGTWLPYYDEPSNGRYLLHVGGSYSYRDAGQEVVRFRERPEARMQDEGGSTVPFFVDTTAISADHWQAAGAEVSWVHGSFNLQSEVIGASVNQLGGPNIDLIGTYVYASYFLTGENRVYRRTIGSFDRPMVNAPFFRTRNENGCVINGPGAWEIAARYSYLDLNDDNVHGGTMSNFTFGVNWYWNEYMRVQWNYIHSVADHPVNDESTANIFLTRFSIFW